MSPATNGTLLLRIINAPGRLEDGDLTRFAVSCADSPAPDPAPTAEDYAVEQLRALKHGRFGTSVIYTDVSLYFLRATWAALMNSCSPMVGASFGRRVGMSPSASSALGTPASTTRCSSSAAACVTSLFSSCMLS
jgi:hypothetical protein